MQNFGIVVHGGAGPDSEHIHQNEKGYHEGLQAALDAGYSVLEEGGSAIDAVEAAVNVLENNPLFNAGRGSAINQKAQVEMCASIMDGSNGKSGAVAIVRNVKNPVTLARAVMEKTNHIYLGSYGALDFAKNIGISLEPDAYFVTEYQYDSYESARKEADGNTQDTALEEIGSRMHGTVGAVAVDKEGNVAAATSTGGTEYAKEGRIGDSSMIGVGSYAENETCAVSTTGDGEYLIKRVAGHEIASLVRYAGLGVPEAIHRFIHIDNKGTEGDMGMISIDREGNFGMAFNSERMHRGVKTNDGYTGTWIYP
ncbi:beta-aspartyl-peptidase (threonine type) [Cnuella takakiae]|uniref:Isoaspartyl peptidase n=1 Tax=Cnuella takakiae TaxID=1302690 RepID=A0A1M5HGJ2_9BACT|nr:isoaspartyl peptidase/L-asparaginase [Cnuella takakiae]OLY92863.1 isoaspartyl peptidase/L-asparaginase [Cnuella takakiae]SHG15065.1 beta-aspartyl-peptidase (threonine type) [Cnuella takakiae]